MKEVYVSLNAHEIHVLYAHAFMCHRHAVEQKLPTAPWDSIVAKLIEAGKRAAQDEEGQR